ncbi:hypothetical protein NMY22_g6229 [Coprinellus aureogranulatus]|nr:hypothetical protein NMY22_g6229 [Coprinellus aureogranulatus]
MPCLEPINFFASSGACADFPFPRSSSRPLVKDMGVHGLTTYLRDNRRLLSKTIELPASPSPKAEFPVVVDGWSFIYTLYHQSELPWVYGGEYQEFYRLVKTVVEAWIHVGLQVHFVFDGAYPDIKFATCVTRLAQSHIQPGLLFFRTSPASRSTPRSLNETRILPPLAYGTCVQALKDVRTESDSLHIHFADEEGDPYAVELAGRLNGYVVGNDSDFVVLNTDGYQGYIPIYDMVWHAIPVADEAPKDNDDNDEFQVVVRPKANRKTRTDNSTLAPPPDSQILKLSVTAYSPVALAAHFRLPVTLLPLLGAIVGNDFTSQMESSKRRIQSLLFERHLSVTQRLEHAAGVIRNVLHPNPNHRKSKYELGSVLDLIERTVITLLNRFDSSTLGPGEVGQVVDNIVEATLQYAIPKSSTADSSLWPSPVCALHPPETCPYLPMVSRRLIHELQDRDIEDEELLQVREKVIAAYRTGSFSPKNMDILSTATCWPRLFLENPDTETVGRSIGQPIRRWVYSVLDDAVGLPDPTASEQLSSGGEETMEESPDDDDIIDVVEEDSEDEANVDLLAPLKGQLSRLHEHEETPQSGTPMPSQRKQRTSPAVVTEYLRKGIRVGEDEVRVAPLNELLESIDLSHFTEEDAPLLLMRSEDERLSVLLKLLKSDTPEVRSLPPASIIPVLVVRWLAQVLHSRLVEKWSKEREKEVWCEREARCLLASFREAPVAATSDEQEGSMVLPNIADRHVQLTAQALAAIEAIDQLKQSLLLGERVPSIGHHFSGRLFHSLLNDSTASLDSIGPMWTAVVANLTSPFRQEAPKKPKKPKPAKTVSTPPQIGKNRSGQGFYALLDSDTP